MATGAVAARNALVEAGALAAEPGAGGVPCTTLVAVTRAGSAGWVLTAGLARAVAAAGPDGAGAAYAVAVPTNDRPATVATSLR